MNTSVKWAAELVHVQEVSLLGTADIAFWKDRLLKENLLPDESGDQAQLLIIAANSEYMGVRFRELSFSVLVSRLEAGVRQDAAYLVRAFNSCRLFAFCERVFFSTPYYHGDVRVSALLPASMHLINKGEVVFAAEMGADASGLGRDSSRCGEDGWEGPYLSAGESTRRRSPGQVVRCATPRIYPYVSVPSGHGLGGDQALARQRVPSDAKRLALRRQGVDRPRGCYAREVEDL